MCASSSDGTTKLADRQYIWHGCAEGNSNADNGNLCAIYDLINPAHNQTFDYDVLNRIKLGYQADHF